MILSPPPGIDQLLMKLDRIHPGHHNRKRPIIAQLVAILDNWITKHMRTNDKRILIILAETLDTINRKDYYVYSELLKRTRYPKIYQQALNYLHWARLHRRLGGKLPFTLRG